MKFRLLKHISIAYLIGLVVIFNQSSAPFSSSFYHTFSPQSHFSIPSHSIPNSVLSHDVILEKDETNDSEFSLKCFVATYLHSYFGQVAAFSVGNTSFDNSFSSKALQPPLYILNRVLLI
ncbi:MAG: hypothetical protein U0Y10_09820 [Spirosomataceae bacterium]